MSTSPSASLPCADAPLIETRVCQYEQTPDSHFIVDRHPANENVWLLGGGSGHGFKHGPAVGEMMAELILRDRDAGCDLAAGSIQEELTTEVTGTEELLCVPLCPLW